MPTISGRGLRRSLLTALGSGDLYSRLDEYRIKLEGGQSQFLEARQDIAALREQLLATERTIGRQQEKIGWQQEEIERQAETASRQAETIGHQAETISHQAETISHQAESSDRQNEIISSLRTTSADQERAVGELEHFLNLKNSNRLIELDYPIFPKVRHGWGKPSEARLAAILSAGEARYAATLSAMLPVIETASAIPLEPTGEAAGPHWKSDWQPAFDAFAIYAFLATRNPKIFMEIGSGTSTKFARRAIADHGLRTKIVSIDPAPRSEIDAICDEVIRQPLENAPLSIFDRLDEGDVLFFDGSHRSSQNTDVTVFFTEVLPAIKAGVLVGIHDIFLPDDYPEDWLDRHYSEQYLLSCWLLGGENLEIVLPTWFCSNQKNLHSILSPLWGAPNVLGAHTHGGSFWLTPK